MLAAVMPSNCTEKEFTRWQARYDYLTHASSVSYARELVANAEAGVGAPSAWSHLQRHLEYCVTRIGCYANAYPWARITVKGNGGYSYVGGKE